ncbi:MAG TPA: CBS domain-containing protein [Deltaproteobacteria bacterium]|nr:CBS domain-containing protein [Deltaproteobacteria bacterium]
MDVIVSHIQADFDAFASMIAARMLYPGAVLAFPGAQEKNLRDYLAEAPGEITEGIARQKDIDLDEITRLVIVDTRQASRIGEFAKIIGREGVEVIVYDHHPCSAEDLHADEEHCVELGSNVAVMVQALKEKGLTPSPAQATVMAMGIYEDTGSLLFPSTTPQDAEALADLIGWGADLREVSRAISRELDAGQVDVLDQLIKNSYVLHIGGIDVLFTRSESASYIEDFAMLVHKLRPMFNVDAMFALGLMGERIYLVARSTLPQINAAEIAGQFGGGGHPTAAAASIKDSSLDQVESRLVNAVKRGTRPRITARDIMTFPVISVSMDASINEASEVLNRYNINAVVVQAEEGQPPGLVTRQVVSRAQGHGLGDARVRDYMIRDIKVVEPDAPVWEIRTLIIDGNQRLLPVVENGTVIGVITRTDLMMVMHEKMAKTEGVELKPPQTKNMRGLLEERLPREIFELLQQAGSLASTMGYNAYLVGGIVRDMLLRINNLDVDIVVEGDGIAFAREFCQAVGARCASHEKYKTAVVTLRDGTHIDVATARLEFYRAPGDFPVVEQSTLKLDLYRRDFTINTMAVSLNPQRFGELIDFFGAQRDIKEKRIRVLHALSFVEDPSRILRAVRFEQRYGFTLGKQTISLIHAAVRSGLLGSVSGRRISHEIRQMLGEEDPAKGLERLDDLGVLTAIHPDFRFTATVRDYFTRVRETLLWFSMLFTHEEFRSWFVYLLALVDQMKAKKIVDICRRLGITEDEIRGILASQERVQEILKGFVSARDLKPSDVVRMLEGASLEVILFAMSKTRSSAVKELISSYVTTWRSYRPPLNGKDLLAIGFTEGKYLGETLRLIRDKGLDGEIRDFKEAVGFARLRLAELKGSQAKG